MRIYLSGPMGAGKSTVGQALAEKTGRPFVDLDACIEARAGQSVRELFRERGESFFRRLERQEARRVVDEGASDAVVALGGGTVTSEETRRLLLGDGVLVTLTSAVETLSARVAEDEGRPLLAGGDAQEVLAALLRGRGVAYAECHGAVATDAGDVDSVVERVLAIVAAAPIPVPLGQRTYRVEVGAGVRRGLGECAVSAARGRILLVTDEAVMDPWGTEARRSLEATGRAVTSVVLSPGEAFKNLQAVEQIWDAALGAGLDRDSLVVAVGGGVVGDLAGFAAATLMRGVAFGQVPTTLLSMVDASVGGKTGFDRPEGKNLVGAFHQPSFVLCDVETLSTLPAADRIAGLAEVAKSAWIAGEGEVAALEADAAALVAGDPEATERAIRMAVTLKASVVAQDEREGGARRLLNLGHTVGHAFETAAGYGAMRHGDAVARGMIAAFRVARALGVGSEADEARGSALLTALGLPTDVAGRGTDEVQKLLFADKKRIGDVVRFVAPGAPGEVEVVPAPITRIMGIVASF